MIGVERVGIDDNFFELGGHSLLMIQIVSRISDAFDVELSLKDFFRLPTVAEQAIALTEMRATQNDPARLHQLLERLDELSAEEVHRLLDEKATAQNKGGLKV